jgi:hypothetical protein
MPARRCCCEQQRGGAGVYLRGAVPGSADAVFTDGGRAAAVRCGTAAAEAGGGG